VPDAKPVEVLWRNEEESWASFARRIRDTKGDVIVILSSADNAVLLQEEERQHFIEDLAKVRYRVRLATKEPAVISEARRAGLRVFDQTRKLRKALTAHPKAAEALRFFSPSLWRQQWRSKLQSAGLLSVPKMRIWILVGLSVALFGFVVLKLLPSADVHVWPRADIVSQTMNITLVATGSQLPQGGRVRSLPLEKIRVTVRKAITFEDISPEFTGTNAAVKMTIYNTAHEQYSFRKGTRLTNQAGMVFRLQDSVVVPASGKTTANAKADDLDLYDEVIGKRGNVPAGLQWEFPGLSPEERKLVYAKNLVAATGGATNYRTVLQQRDIDTAEKRLRQELLVNAKQQVEEQRQLMNATGERQIELLAKDDVISATYSGFVLPTAFLGQPVVSVPVEGSLTYVMPAYDLKLIQATYSDDLLAHTGVGKQLLSETVHVDPSRIIIIEYDDNFGWIKVTADILGTEQYELDPLSPDGARFGKRVRESIAGLSVHDAVRILRNFPEVDKVEIKTWPPWNTLLPAISSNIRITPQ
jgi:hypothetical protein